MKPKKETKLSESAFHKILDDIEDAARSINTIYEFVYTDCIYESAMATISLHKTKKGAYKAMRKFLEEGYSNWYNLRILHGKDRDGEDKFGIHCTWAVRSVRIEE